MMSSSNSVSRLVECIDKVGVRFRDGGDTGFWCESDAMGLLVHYLWSAPSMIGQPCGKRSVSVPLFHLEVPTRAPVPGKKRGRYDLALFSAADACNVGDQDMRYADYGRQIAKNRRALAVVEMVMCGPTVNEGGKLADISYEIAKIRENALAGQTDCGIVAVFCWTHSTPGTSSRPRAVRPVSRFSDDIDDLSRLLSQSCPRVNPEERVYIYYVSDSPHEPPPAWIRAKP